jgi:hypothetical protein
MWPWDSAQRWGGPVQPFNGRAKLCTQRKQADNLDQISEACRQLRN